MDVTLYEQFQIKINQIIKYPEFETESEQRLKSV